MMKIGSSFVGSTAASGFVERWRAARFDRCVRQRQWVGA
jgi:hypothetical protein